MKIGDIPIVNPMRGTTPIMRVMRGTVLIWERVQAVCDYLYTQFTMHYQEDTNAISPSATANEHDSSAYISGDGEVLSELIWRKVLNDTYNPFKMNISIRKANTPWDFTDVNSMPHGTQLVLESNLNDDENIRYHTISTGCTKLWLFSTVRGGYYLANGGDCEYPSFDVEDSISFYDWGAGEYQRSPQFSHEGYYLFMGMTGLGGDKDRARIYAYKSIGGTPWNYWGNMTDEYHWDMFDKTVSGKTIEALMFFHFLEEGDKILIGFYANDGTTNIFTADLSTSYGTGDWGDFSNFQLESFPSSDEEQMLKIAIPNTIDGDCLDRLYANAWYSGGGVTNYRMEFGKEDSIN